MNLIRACMVALAVLIPASWTLAHAGDEGDKSGETTKKSKKKSKKTEGGGDTGGEKKGDMDKK